MEFLTAYSEAMERGSVVSVDESGFDQRCRPVYGYSPSGTQAIVEVLPCKDRKRYNLIMAIHPSGTHHAVLRDQSTTGSAFADFITRMPFPKGSTVLLDGAAIHKTAEVRQAAEKRGYSLLFTPPYSPEYNPIEMVFGSIKNAFYTERYSPAFQDDLRGAVDRCVAFRTTPATIKGTFGHVQHLVSREMALRGT